MATQSLPHVAFDFDRIHSSLFTLAIHNDSEIPYLSLGVAFTAANESNGIYCRVSVSAFDRAMGAFLYHASCDESSPSRQVTWISQSSD